VVQDQGFGRALLMACDATGYGSGDDQLQAAMQDGLIRVLDEAAIGAGLVRSEWDKNSTGDGELALLPASESEPRVVDDFVRELGAALARHNRHLADRARLRLRVAIHYGVAYPASNGYAGQGVVAVSRLLDSAPIREAMRQSDTELALILSDGVYSETVLNGHTSLRPQDFCQVEVRIKEFAANAWIWLPHGDVHSLPLTAQQAGGALGRPTVETLATSGPRADHGIVAPAADPGAGRQEAQRLSTHTEFYGPVHAPGSVFGIDLSGH
jgi:class 3 adenylate cyclase